MPDCCIRAALPRDLEVVYAVFSLADNLHRRAHPEIFKQAEDPKEIKDYLLTAIRSEDAAVFVADVGGEIIGAVLAWARHTSENPVLVPRTYASVENLVVLEGFRQRGVGSALMARIHLWAKVHGINRVYLTVWEFNEGAQAFYHELGYEMLHHRMYKEMP